MLSFKMCSYVQKRAKMCTNRDERSNPFIYSRNTND